MATAIKWLFYCFFEVEISFYRFIIELKVKESQSVILQ